MGFPPIPRLGMECGEYFHQDQPKFSIYTFRFDFLSFNILL